MAEILAFPARPVEPPPACSTPPTYEQMHRVLSHRVDDLETATISYLIRIVEQQLMLHGLLVALMDRLDRLEKRKPLWISLWVAWIDCLIGIFDRYAPPAD